MSMASPDVADDEPACPRERSDSIDVAGVGTRNRLEASGKSEL